MVEHSSLDAVFSALADPTRRAMLRKLSQGAHSVGDLAAPFSMTFAGASKHVKALEKAGLVTRSVEGRTHMCQLNAQPMHGALEWLRYYETFWNARLDDLERELNADDERNRT